MTRPVRLAGIGAGEAFPDGTAVEDVFSTYLYTGNGSTQTINNGINLAGKGGMVWLKGRTGTSIDNYLTDTVRGKGNALITNSAGANFNDTANWTTGGFNNNGFTVPGVSSTYFNNPGYTYASWTFRKQPKFFDVVTYTGDGTNSRNIAHSLGVVPGMVVVKRLDVASNWQTSVVRVWSGSSPLGYSYMQLNTTAASYTGSDGINANGLVVAQYPTFFTVTNGATDGAAVNASGGTYVAYLFAHDTSATGMIQCGSFTTDAFGGPTANVGSGWFDSQWVLMKRTDAAGNWFIVDDMRGFFANSATDSNTLLANSTAVEAADTIVKAESKSTSSNIISPFGSSFANGTFVYIAIRRGPMRTPTDGTKVFMPVTYTGNASNPRDITGFGFSPDLILQGYRDQVAGAAIYDRLRGAGYYLSTSATGAEVNGVAGFSAFLQDGDRVAAGNNTSAKLFVQEGFKRAPGFFDVVCYTGAGGGGQFLSTNLNANAEMVIVKPRSAAGAWYVGHKDVSPAPTYWTNLLRLNTTAAVTNDGTNVTGGGVGIVPANQFYVFSGNVDGAGVSYVAYLFASCPGVSKVGSYTGNGSSQTINCGFTAGARFVLIKRADSTGDWYVWDTARGIVTANDPHLSLNTTAAEVTTDDSVDADATGFIVNQVAATNVNVNAATYIFLAIA